jgi:hypothetical protein
MEPTPEYVQDIGEFMEIVVLAFTRPGPEQDVKGLPLPFVQLPVYEVDPIVP